MSAKTSTALMVFLEAWAAGGFDPDPATAEAGRWLTNQADARVLILTIAAGTAALVQLVDPIAENEMWGPNSDTMAAAQSPDEYADAITDRLLIAASNRDTDMVDAHASVILGQASNSLPSAVTGRLLSAFRAAWILASDLGVLA
jgi:hypothetical protein